MFYSWKHVSRNLQQETFDNAPETKFLETNVLETKFVKHSVSCLA